MTARALAASVSATAFMWFVVHAQWGCETQRPPATPTESPTSVPVDPSPTPSARSSSEAPTAPTNATAEPKPKNGPYGMQAPTGPYLSSSKSDPDMLRRNFFAESGGEAEEVARSEAP
jgi:cytoskeletal protein RodZ